MKRIVIAAIALLASVQALGATCNVAEFPFALPVDANGNVVQIATLSETDPVAQTVTYTTSTAATNAFDSATRMIRVTCDANAHIDLGATPVADTENLRIAAGATEYYNLIPGQVSGGTLKIAFYDGTS